ncbi:MAG: phage terminase small subunit [Anaerovoracaceae bacterium]
MARPRNPKREEAYRLWVSSGHKMYIREIAEQLEVSEALVRKWKSLDKWNGNTGAKLNGNSKGKRGAPFGNKNGRGKGPPKGNKNAEGNLKPAPKENKYSETHGLFSKYLPKETLELVEAAQKQSPLDLLWDQIAIKYANIIKAQKIMYVKDKKDSTTTVIAEGTGDGHSSKSYDVQQAWEKQANFMQSEARAMAVLNSMIKTYEELLHKNWELASEEQKLRIANIKAQTSQIKSDISGGIEIKVSRDYGDKTNKPK